MALKRAIVTPSGSICPQNLGYITVCVALQRDFAVQVFTDGLIISLHKRGDRTNPSNYCPITLLNYDYRTFARILANTLTIPMQRLIADTQTAFLPGRSSNINMLWTLQMLPYWLQAERPVALRHQAWNTHPDSRGSGRTAGSILSMASRSRPHVS